MPTTKPRVNVALEKPLYREVRELAERNGTTMSTEIRDLILEALQIEEDRILTRWASDRLRTYKPAKALSHGAVWGHLHSRRKS